MVIQSGSSRRDRAGAGPELEDTVDWDAELRAGSSRGIHLWSRSRPAALHAGPPRHDVRDEVRRSADPGYFPRSGSTSTGIHCADRSRRQVGARHGAAPHRRGASRASSRKEGLACSTSIPAGDRDSPRRSEYRDFPWTSIARGVEHRVAAAQQALGGFDGLVNNAGVNRVLRCGGDDRGRLGLLFAVDLKAA